MIDKEILLATMDSEGLEFFKRHLQGVAELVLVRDAAAALAYIVNEVPDMVIVDVDLPLISGSKLYKILKNNPRTREIPFLFIGKSAKDIEGFREGIDGFFTKPFNEKEFHSEIQQILFHGKPIPSIETGEKSDELELRIIDLRMKIRQEVTDEFLKKKEEAQKEGKYPWEGMWLTPNVIRSVQDKMKVRDRAVFTEMVFLFLFLAFISFSFLIFVYAFLPGQNGGVLNNIVEEDSMSPAPTAVLEEIQTIAYSESPFLDSRGFDTSRKSQVQSVDPDSEYSTGRVRASELNLRKGPGTHFPIMDKVMDGEIVIIQERDGLWLRVIADQSSEGWVSGEYVDVVD